MPERVGNIELYMGPQEVGGPDSLLDAIVDFLNGAERRLEIAACELAGGAVENIRSALSEKEGQ